MEKTVAGGKGRCDCLLDRWMLQCAQWKKKENSRREETEKQETRSVRRDREWGKERRFAIVLSKYNSFLYFLFISYW
jgi:hypothetical protein